MPTKESSLKGSFNQALLNTERKFLRSRNASMSQNSATLVGLLAIVLWSLFAALTVATGRIPAFQLAAMTFALGACVEAPAS